MAALKPLKPALSVETLIPVPGTEPYSKFPGRFQQFRFAVRNNGLLPLWLRPNDIPIPDESWHSNAAEGDPAYVGIYDWDDDNYTKLAPGNVRVYDLVIHAEFKQFHLSVDVRDWRGRDANKYFGLHDTGPHKSGEPCDAHEAPRNDFTNGNHIGGAR